MSSVLEILFDHRLCVLTTHENDTSNISIYGVFGHNCLIDLINGSDETVHREPLRLSRIRWIANGRARCHHVSRVIKPLTLDLDLTSPMRFNAF